MKAASLMAALLLAGSATACVKKSTHQQALARITSLEGDVAARDKDLADRDAKLRELDGELATTKADRDAKAGLIATKDSELTLAAGERAATQAELEELRRSRDAAEKRASAYRDLQKKFAALVDTGALKVAFRSGQMVLQLPSGVLFASGKGELSSDGETALAEIVRVLDQFKDRRFMIAGHTDNVPIKSRSFANNWYLSTARAISVLQFMVDSGFPAKNLAAAGYGEQDPIQPNDTEAGREQNRRIEIILVPNLEELPSLTGATP